MSRHRRTLRQAIGCWLTERWRTELVLRLPRVAAALGWTWLDLRNRHERLREDSVTGGRILPGGQSSRLTVARLYPEVGGRLLQHCLARWPVALEETTAAMLAEDPEVSIVIGVRGTGRLPQFRRCLASLAAQRNARCEIIVVEQSWRPEFKDIVPAHVRYLHQQATSADMPYNRSWALNAGVRAAKGAIVVLHDADMVVPVDFAAAIAERIRSGLDAVRLPRFIFYLDQATSAFVQESGALPGDLRVDTIVANNRTPVAVTRDAYLRIGGHDESFYGWGAEDDEFMDRLGTLRVGEGAFLPIVHLWHPEAQKRDAHVNAGLLAMSREVPMPDRILHLNGRGWGQDFPSVSRESALNNLDAKWRGFK